jgi:hypothetical protein
MTLKSHHEFKVGDLVKLIPRFFLQTNMNYTNQGQLKKPLLSALLIVESLAPLKNRPGIMCFRCISTAEGNKMFILYEDEIVLISYDE